MAEEGKDWEEISKFPLAAVEMIATVVGPSFGGFL
jgi:hypothetical protein